MSASPNYPEVSEIRDLKTILTEDEKRDAAMENARLPGLGRDRGTRQHDG